MIFSVIVPFLNEERYIEKCLTSLMNQDFSRDEYELIFIDNGSTDNSAAIVRKFHGVQILSENKRYEYVARNKGIASAKGGIMAFTNADCTVPVDWLRQIYDTMRQTGADILLGRVCFPRNISDVLRMAEDYENLKMEYTLTRYGRKFYFANANNMAVKAQVFGKSGPFAEWHRASDTELLQRLLSADRNARVRYMTGAGVTHLEITNIPRWLAKVKGYGENNALVKKSAGFIPLDHKKNLEIIKDLLKKNNYGIAGRVGFFIFLAFSWLAYKTGEAKGYIRLYLWKR